MVLQQRLKQYVDSTLAEEQCGFRIGRGRVVC